MAKYFQFHSILTLPILSIYPRGWFNFKVLWIVLNSLFAKERKEVRLYCQTSLGRGEGEAEEL